jgi:hypothetical protein
MELRQNVRRVATRPIAWLTAVLVALAIGLIGFYALQGNTRTHPTGAGTPTVTSLDPPRNGGPGGQFGDAPQPGQTARSGGPGGQIGDAP